jgi:hypothetical protein
MPVEAIHLSAFSDSLARSSAPGALQRGRLFEVGRLGSVVIDFPYFAQFPLGVLRYLLKRPTALSEWAKALHFTTPVAVAHVLLEHTRALRAHASTLTEANEVLAYVLGYVSHLAVDRSLHPLVNQLARERAAKVGRDPAHHHTDVEKYHSVLFHEARLGFDFMGRRELSEHIQVDAHAIHREAHLSRALCAGFGRALGRTPALSELRDWASGYRQYVALVSSPLGKTLAPEPAKRAMHDEIYVGAWGSFPERYERAVEAARSVLDATLRWAENANDGEEFVRVMPEGPIDLD